jgi:ADP-heptose:LPS heptosyltransferase
MGDAVIVRSLAEHLRQRHPEMGIGVMGGEATSEVLTMGADFRLHQYIQRRLSLGSALLTLKEIKACNYDTVLNFEQGSLAGTGFLRATGIPNRLGFLSSSDAAKGAFLTHGLRFQPVDSMWESFGRLLRLADPDLPTDLPFMPLPLSREAVQIGQSWLKAKANGSCARKIVFHLGCGAGQPFKRWQLRTSPHWQGIYP